MHDDSLDNASHQLPKINLFLAFKLTEEDIVECFQFKTALVSVTSSTISSVGGEGRQPTPHNKKTHMDRILKRKESNNRKELSITDVNTGLFCKPIFGFTGLHRNLYLKPS